MSLSREEEALKSYAAQFQARRNVPKRGSPADRRVCNVLRLAARRCHDSAIKAVLDSVHSGGRTRPHHKTARHNRNAAVATGGDTAVATATGSDGGAATYEGATKRKAEVPAAPAPAEGDEWAPATANASADANASARVAPTKAEAALATRLARAAASALRSLRPFFAAASWRVTACGKGEACANQARCPFYHTAAERRHSGPQRSGPGRRCADRAYYIDSYKVVRCGCGDPTGQFCSSGAFHVRAGDRRRRPRVGQTMCYAARPCPALKTSAQWRPPTFCTAGDACKFAHSASELLYHPDVYKAHPCQAEIQSEGCPRGLACPYLHADEASQLEGVRASFSGDKAAAAPVPQGASAAATAPARLSTSDRQAGRSPPTAGARVTFTRVVRTRRTRTVSECVAWHSFGEPPKDEMLFLVVNYLSKPSYSAAVAAASAESPPAAADDIASGTAARGNPTDDGCSFPGTQPPSAFPELPGGRMAKPRLPIKSAWAAPATGVAPSDHPLSVVVSAGPNKFMRVPFAALHRLPCSPPPPLSPTPCWVA